MEALEDESLHYLVESFECIPVKSAYTGSLCKPSDLVWQSGPISDMFQESSIPIIIFQIREKIAFKKVFFLNHSLF
jgi:hypothetical protein